MRQTITVTFGVIGLLALTLVGRELLASLGGNMGMEFSLRQSRSERGPAQVQAAAARSRTLAPAAPRCEPPAFPNRATQEESP